MTDKQTFYHDHNTLEEFVRALATAHEYSSWEISGMINNYWKEEAEEWVRQFDAEKEETKAEVLALWQDGKVL